MEWYWVLAIVIGVLYVWIDYIIAKEMYVIAEMKGHPQKKYFWLSLLLGIHGCCLVIALPDRAATQSRRTIVDELPEL